MARTSKGQKGHTRQTDGGNTRDVKIERIGPVTIYKRGETYSLNLFTRQTPLRR